MLRSRKSSAFWKNDLLDGVSVARLASVAATMVGFKVVVELVTEESTLFLVRFVEL